MDSIFFRNYLDAITKKCTGSDCTFRKMEAANSCATEQISGSKRKQPEFPLPTTPPKKQKISRRETSALIKTIILQILKGFPS